VRFLIPVIFLLLGLAGGVGAGIFLGRGEAPETTEEQPEEEAPAGDDAAAEGASDAGDESVAFVTPAGDGTEYVRLRNQFIVPVVRDGSVRSLVVLALTVEIGTGGNDAVFQHEPRLRDSFLRVLFAHANAGGFDGAFTEASAMAPLRQGLREAAVSVLGDTVRDVLIVDITRQDA
jgi:flagellar protein FliL